MKLKFMLKFFLIITLTTLGYIIIDSTFENIYSHNKIEEFKNECVEVSSPNKFIMFHVKQKDLPLNIILMERIQGHHLILLLSLNQPLIYGARHLLIILLVVTPQFVWMNINQKI